MMGNALGLPRGRSLTRADLEAMPDDGHRYELVDGVLLVSPSPRPLHQRAILRLILALQAHCSAEWEVLPAPVDVVLDDDTVLIPDVIVAHQDDFTEHNLPVPPLLAVEVLSPSTRRFDLELKRCLLESFGCRNYWVVDTELPSLRCWSLRDGGYTEVATARGNETVELVDPFALRLCPADLVSSRRS
jgi:Uma2 family endonuclease